MAENLAKLVKLGKDLGYEKDALQNFVAEQQRMLEQEKKEEKERDRQEKDRQDKKEKEEKDRQDKEKKEERDRQEKDRQDKKEKEEKDRQDKKEEKERDRQERERDRQMEESREDRLHKERLKQFELELQERSRMNQAVETKPAKEVAPKLPKLPLYHKEDDIADYLLRFKNHARNAMWKEEMWGSYLTNLLTGEALQVIHFLSTEEQNNFKSIEKALLQHFQLTDAGYRQKFLNCKPAPQENIGSFLNKIKRYFDRWIELAGVDNRNYEQLYNLMLIDRIYSNCSIDLTTFCKERNPKTIPELKAIAEQYVEAHPTVPLARETRQIANFSQSNAPYQQRDSRGMHRNRDIVQNSNYRQPHRSMSQGPPRQWSRRYDNSSDRYWQNQRPIYRPQSNNYRSNRNNYWSGRDDRQQQQNYGPPNYNNYSRQRQGQYQSPRNRSMSQERHSSATRFNRHRSESRGGRANLCSQINNREAQNITAHPEPAVAQTVSAGNLGFQTTNGTVNGKSCKVLRDTGANCIGVAKELVHPEDYTGKTVTCLVYGGDKIHLDTAIVKITSPYYCGTAEVHVLNSCDVADVIIGNVNEALRETNTQRCYAREEEDANVCDKDEQFANYATRAQTKYAKTQESENEQKVEQDDKIGSDNTRYDKFNHVNFLAEQLKDKFCTQVKENNDPAYCIKNELLFRKCRGNGKDQLVVPQSLKTKLLSEAHDSPYAAHKGIAATIKLISKLFHWPRMFKEVKEYVRSCDTCQRKSAREPKLPIQLMDENSAPFQRVAADIIGPMPASNGKRFILTLVDFNSRWAEAVALRNIRTVDVLEALNSIFLRMGFPVEILTDGGKQFCSKEMEKAFKELSIQHTISTPYHQQSNGRCERLNGTLKAMLGKLANDNPNKWSHYLDKALFAYRQTKHSSTGFSPFELVFGRAPRGHMSIIHDLCTNRQTTYDPQIQAHLYLESLQSKIADQCKEAQRNSAASAVKYAEQANSKSKRVRKLNVGDRALALLPTNNNSAILSYQGPFEVIAFRGNNNYELKIGTKSRIYHANLLKRYHVRNQEQSRENIFRQTSHLAIIYEEADESEEDIPQIISTNHLQTENVTNVVIDSSLAQKQKDEVKAVLHQYKQTMSDVPGQTNLIEHEILLNNYTPFRKSYPIPFAAREELDKEIAKMKEMGIVRNSKSPFSSPLTIVRKKDNTIRPCVDFRILNQRVVFDAQPIPNQNELFAKIGKAEYFSKIDLTKGYFQIPLVEKCKKYTAFKVNDELLEFNFLPFGLSTASSTFQTMMRLLLRDVKNTISYFDDILVFSSTWNEHVKALTNTLQALKNANLTAKPSKTFIGLREIEFLGHIITHRKLKPDPSKIEKMLKLRRPTNKKEVKKICGLLNYYRHFVPHFSEILQPLTQLLCKGTSNQVKWTEQCEEAFTKIKEIMSQPPILRLPDLSRPFIIRTDASDYGIAGVLTQEDKGSVHPIHYVSRKLLPRETKYAIVEKECLAILFTINCFKKYLAMNHFQIESDHKSLSFLRQNATKNNRLMRWSLALQNYSFSIKYIKGSDNAVPDVLSRF